MDCLLCDAKAEWQCSKCKMTGSCTKCRSNYSCPHCGRRIIVIAPHKCQPGVMDRACDPRSDYMAQRIHSVLGGTLVESNVSREVCDLNRSQCRDAAVRKTLRAAVGDYTTTFIVEVHSFPAEAALITWKLHRVPSSVVLYTHGLVGFEENVARELGSAVIPGDPVVNDISAEATQRGWKNHVLLELYDGNSDEDIVRIANALKRVIDRAKRETDGN